MAIFLIYLMLFVKINIFFYYFCTINLFILFDFCINFCYNIMEIMLIEAIRRNKP